MAKKDFTQADPGALYQSIAQATAEKRERVFTEEEKTEMRQNMKTRGQKGVWLKRINVAFSDDVYDYVTTMAQVRGQTITQFINHILRQNMEQNMEIYEKAIEFRNSL